MKKSSTPKWLVHGERCHRSLKAALPNMAWDSYYHGIGDEFVWGSIPSVKSMQFHPAGSALQEVPWPRGMRLIHIHYFT